MKKMEGNAYHFMHIMEEAPLYCYPELFIQPAVRSVVLFETAYRIGVALRDASEQLYLIYERRAEWSPKRNEEIRADVRRLYDHVIADDNRIVTRLLAFGHTVNEFTDKLVTAEIFACGNAAEGGLDDVIPGQEEIGERLSYIRENCAPEDCFGVYGMFGTAFWWWEEKPRVLHILGSKSVNLPEDKAEYYEEYADDPKAHYIGQGKEHPECILFCCGWEEKISRLVIHEGIRAFQPFVPLMNGHWSAQIDEVILPSTLWIMPTMMCYADRVTVPESVSEINFADLWVDCGGHFDPVTYAFRSLRLPSSIRIDVDMEDEDYHGQLPLLEPVAHWEEIVLYGDEPVRDLDEWYASNVFLCDIRILYPAAWDEGTQMSFTERVVSYVRSRSPQYGWQSGMDSEWADWGEEQYEALRERIRPY